MDDSISLVIGTLSGLVYALGQASESALHHYSHTKLEKMLGESERLLRLNAALKDFDRQIFSLALGHAFFGVCFVVLVLDGLDQHMDPHAAFALLLLVLVLILTGIVRELVYRAPERAVLTLLPVVRLMTLVTAPLVVPIMAVGRVLGRRLGGAEELSDEEDAVEEILDAVSEGEAEGVLEEDAADFIENIMGARDRVVREIMTPRTSMISAPAEMSFDEALEVLNDSGHSRLPVYQETRDNIVGMLYFKDLLKQLGDLQSGEKQIIDILRPPVFVPETKKINELLKELQEQKIHIAVVLDEFGGTSGLVTLEDILEEIVGELQDEFDEDEVAVDVDVVAEGMIEVDARMTIDALNERLELELPDEGDYDTVGGFLATRLGKVPSTGETLEVDGWQIEVADADDRRVKRVRITTPAEPESD